MVIQYFANTCHIFLCQFLPKYSWSIMNTAMQWAQFEEFGAMVDISGLSETLMEMDLKHWQILNFGKITPNL